MTNPTKTSSHYNHGHITTDKELPQPENSNHISTAPFRYKVITNSSYLAAEIPLKFGHFVSNLWHQRPQPQCTNETIWLLGSYYHALSAKLDSIQLALLDAQRTDMFGADEPNDDLVWPPDFYEDFNSKVWMTYRHNYPPIRPSNHRTDIGWGCMLRSGQSLLANTLVMNLLSRDWRRHKRSPEIVKQYKKIIHWFFDELSPRAPFSIHRIALLGKQLGKDIGEWFGPSTISQVIQALVSDYPPANLAVYITTDAVIYRDNVVDMATGKVTPKGFPTKSPQQQEAKNLYDANNIPLPSISHTSWKPILILVPLRLGIDSLHPTYYATLKALFQLPWFVGIAGGKPNSSLYFIGCQGDDFIYLDPHFSRPALETKPLMYYTMNDFGTYHCTVPRKIHVSNLDPSMMLGFFCHTRHEFDTLCVQLENISVKYTPVLTIQQKVPQYDDGDVYSDVYSDDEESVVIKCEENDFGIIAEDDDCDIDQDDDLLFV